MISILFFTIYVMLITEPVLFSQSITFLQHNDKDNFIHSCYMKKEGDSNYLQLESPGRSEMVSCLSDSDTQSRYVDLRKYNFEFSLDCFKIPAIAVQANANFTVGYIFSLDEDCSPRNIKFITFDKTTDSVMKGVLDSDEIFSCMKRWKLKGLNKDSIYTK